MKDGNVAERGDSTTEVEILWTGGLDSTFRVTQLSRLPVRIRPYYLSDRRRSEQLELGAIEQVTALLQASRETRAELCPLNYVAVADRVADAEVSAAYQRLQAAHHLGSQYEWLGAFARRHPGIELSVHDEDRGGLAAVRAHGALIERDDPVLGPYQEVDPDRSSPDIRVLFGHYRLPITTFSKPQMRAQLAAWGGEDVMAATWFCYRPRRDQPCGVCNPCVYTIEEGVTAPFGADALRRYERRKRQPWRPRLRSVAGNAVRRVRRR